MKEPSIIWRLIATVMLMFAMASGALLSSGGCMADEDDKPTPTPVPTSGPTSTPGGSPTVTPTFKPGYDLRLIADATEIPRGVTVRLQAILRFNGVAVPDGTLVNFTATEGGLLNFTMTTSGGIATTGFTCTGHFTSDVCASYFPQSACLTLKCN